MIELAIVSGKGGTGKTSIVGSLAALAENKVMVDCDVDAADLHLILDHKVKQTAEFKGGYRASIDNELCTGCGICFDYCRFDAIKSTVNETYGWIDKFRIEPLSCEGCGICVEFCPENAIDFNEIVSGQWFVSDTKYGPLVHARLGIAQANSGKLVSLLRTTAREMAEENKLDMVIIDGPPGIGCPVIASVTGTSYVLIITQPSLSAFHDMKRVVQLIEHFNISCGICINMFDINQKITAELEEFARQKNIKVLGKIPYDTDVTKAQVAGTTVVEYCESNLSENIKLLWQILQSELKNTNQKKRSTTYENRNTFG
jgi:MinD superfamily P-loop ATPase